MLIYWKSKSGKGNKTLPSYGCNSVFAQIEIIHGLLTEQNQISQEGINTIHPALLICPSCKILKRHILKERGKFMQTLTAFRIRPVIGAQMDLNHEIMFRLGGVQISKDIFQLLRPPDQYCRPLKTTLACTNLTSHQHAGGRLERQQTCLSESASKSAIHFC